MTSRPQIACRIASQPRVFMRLLSIVLAFGSGVAAAAEDGTLSQTTEPENANREGDTPKVAFVTSVAGTGNLSSWEDAHGQNGIAAGDEICQTRAAAAGLDNPDAFRAWLSDATTDAYCHIQGQTGRIANHCNTFLLLGAGPWMRTDGEPFADVIDQVVTNSRIYSPLAFDEFGETVRREVYFTGTSYDGTSGGDTETCSSWTSAASGGPSYTFLGSTDNTGENWTSSGFGGYGCGYLHRLACLESGSGSALPQTPPRGGRMAFVSSTTTDGNITAITSAGTPIFGVVAADFKCQYLAGIAGLYDPGSFKALLGIGIAAPTDRIEHDGPWMRTDGLLFANGLTDLTSALGPIRPLNVDEGGNFAGSGLAWTGLNSTDTCSEWHSNAATNRGHIGNTINTEGDFLDWGSTSCDDAEMHLYCLSDSDAIFHDGLEGTLTGLPQ